MSLAVAVATAPSPPIGALLRAAAADLAAVTSWGGSAGEPGAADDRALVERARTDPEAFSVLYRRHVDRIYAFVYRRCRTRTLAEDITAATFERALRGIDSFRWRGGGFGAWLHRIAANELASHYRREARTGGDRARAAAARLSLPVGAYAADPADAVDSDVDDEIRSLLAALATLRPRYQEAVSLRYLAGLSAEDAAHAMGIPKPALAVLLHRALGALRRAVDAPVATRAAPAVPPAARARGREGTAP